MKEDKGSETRGRGSRGARGENAGGRGERSRGRGRGGDQSGENQQGTQGGRGAKGEGTGGRRRRERGSDDMERHSNLNEMLIEVFRCSATAKGGRRLSFAAIVAVGDGAGRVGIGYGKAKEVPSAVQKATKAGQRAMKRFQICGDGTIPHQVRGRFGASEVLLIPAKPGTGVIAGVAVKAVLEAAGLRNVLTKCYGSTNSRNVTKAALAGLMSMRSKEQIQELRGITIA